MDLSTIQIVEPATMITDYMIAALAWYLGWKMYANSQSVCQKWWAVVFALIGLSAMLGGTYHGFQRIIDPAVNSIIWESTRWIIFFVSFTMLVGHSKAILNQRFTKWVFIFALIKLSAFFSWATANPSFLVAIADYLPVLLFILIAELFVWKIYGSKESKYLVTGILVLLLGAVVQQMGIGINQYFNHNDVYHVVTLVGLYLLYLGIIGLRDFEHRSAVPTSP